MWNVAPSAMSPPRIPLLFAVATEEERQAAHGEEPELLVVVGRMLLPLAAGGHGIGKAGIVLALGEEVLERLPELVGETGEGSAEDELADPVRAGRGIDDRHEPSGRVPEEIHALEAEVRAQLLEIGRVVPELVAWRGFGAVYTAGAELDQRPVAVEPTEIGEELHGGSGPAGMADERRPSAQAPVFQRASVRRREGRHENAVL